MIQTCEKRFETWKLEYKVYGMEPELNKVKLTCSYRSAVEFILYTIKHKSICVQNAPDIYIHETYSQYYDPFPVVGEKPTATTSHGDK